MRLLFPIASLFVVLWGLHLPSSEMSVPPPSSLHASPVDTLDTASTATLILERDTFALTINTCDFTGEVDASTATLSTTMEAPGATLDLEATRSRLRGSLIHRIHVALHDGDQILLEHVAERTYGLGAWTSMHDGPEAALLHIAGDTLTATGRFGPPLPRADTTTAVLDGELHAVCR